MSRRNILIIHISLLLAACVQAPVFKGEGFSLVKSSYPIVNLNGSEIEPAYAVDIEAGDNTMVIVYHSYQYDYACTFTWNAIAGTAYEVVDQDNRYPLTLYRWKRKNSLWAIRLDPVDPLQCTRGQESQIQKQ